MITTINEFRKYNESNNNYKQLVKTDKYAVSVQGNTFRLENIKGRYADDLPYLNITKEQADRYITFLNKYKSETAADVKQLAKIDVFTKFNKMCDTLFENEHELKFPGESEYSDNSDEFNNTQRGYHGFAERKINENIEITYPFTKKSDAINAALDNWHKNADEESLNALEAAMKKEHDIYSLIENNIFIADNYSRMPKIFSVIMDKILNINNTGKFMEETIPTIDSEYFNEQVNIAFYLLLKKYTNMSFDFINDTLLNKLAEALNAYDLDFDDKFIAN